METDRTIAIRKIVEGLDPQNDEHWLPDSGQPRISVVSERFGGPVARNEIDAAGRTRPEIGSLLRPAKPKQPTAPVEPKQPDPVVGHDAHVDNGAPETPVITEDEAARNVATATKLLEEARQALRDQHNDVRVARGKSAAALRDWLAEFPPKTHEQNVRDMIATNQKLKQDIADGLVTAPAGPVPGPSHLDRIRMRPTGVDRGFRSTHSRGALPPSMRGATIQKPESE